MERLEPIIEPQVTTLKKKVGVSWQELKKLRREKDEPTLDFAAEEIALPDEVVEAIEAQKSAEKRKEPQPLVLTEAEKAAMIEAILPAIEAKVHDAVKSAVALSIGNAVTRLRSDLDKTLNMAVMREVRNEIEKLDLSKIIKR